MIALIVDDSIKRVDRLTLQLQQIEFPFIETFLFSRNLKETSVALKRYNPDLVFINQDMQRGSFILEEIDINCACFIIMASETTLHTKLISKNEHCAFIQSPFSKKELESIVLDLYIAKFKTRVQGLESNQTNEEYTRKIPVSSMNKIVFVETRSIMYCKASRQYTEIFLDDGKMLLSSKTLSYYQEKLEESDFLRVHRSYLINLNHVNEFHRHNDEILLSDNILIKLSNSMKDRFLKEMMLQ